MSDFRAHMCKMKRSVLSRNRDLYSLAAIVGSGASRVMSAPQ